MKSLWMPYWKLVLKIMFVNVTVLWHVHVSCAASQSWAELSQSELMSAGITAPAGAHVSITANLIICQCESLKSIPVSFNFNISRERHTSELKASVWYHVRLGSYAFLWQEMPICWWVRVNPTSAQMMSWLWCMIKSHMCYRSPAISGQCHLSSAKKTASIFYFLQVLSEAYHLQKMLLSQKKHLGLVQLADVSLSINYLHNSQMTHNAMQNA